MQRPHHSSPTSQAIEKTARFSRPPGFIRLWVFLAGVWGLMLPAAAENDPHESTDRRPLVLTLHSHSASPWDNELQNGINRELIEPGKIDIYVDYMDAKKLETPEYLNMFCEVLKIKYRHLKFDLVIVCDETAYRYARMHHDQFWPGTPVVFCGVNGFRPQEFASLRNMTGIAENTDLLPFVASFRNLVPHLKKLYVIRDDSTYSVDTLPHLTDAIRTGLPGIRVEELTNRLTAAEMADTLARLPPDSAVFYLSFWRENGGRIINRSEAQRIIQHSVVPVFTTHQSMMGFGATGVCYVDAFEHGLETGRVAKKILSGTDPSAIPAAVGAARQMAFDHGLLKRFGIPRSALPAGGIVFNEPFSFYKKYRKLVWATSAVFALLLALLALLALNMLQRRRITLRLVESEEKFARAFHESPAGMLICHLATGRCIEINALCLQILGRDRDAVLGRSWSQIGLPPSLFDQTAAGQEPGREVAIQRPDGSELACTCGTHPVKIGGLEFLLVILVDISSRKRAEAEREKLQAQLNQAQKMELIGRLAGGVAHDFNNMLTAIQINAAEARQAIAAGRPAEGNLDEIVSCSQRSSAFTQRLLAFARKQAIAPKVIDLNQTIEGTLEIVRRLIDEKIEIRWNPGPELWPLKIDPSQVDQILTNLCVNARDAISGNGTIVIGTQNASFDRHFCRDNPGYEAGDFVRLLVRDTGCGMSAETRQHIFEPFFTTKAAGKGTGLGLATIHGIVKQNKGFILVDSEAGKGTTMRVYLPRHAGTAEPAVDVRRPARALGGRETILMVEDEPSILQITRNALQNLGYTVIAANTPKEGLRIAGQHTGHIDLLITDVVMPGMNGPELEANVRKIHPHIKSLFISGYTSDLIVHEGILDEGINFLPKPFNVPQIDQAIRQALGAPAPRQPAPV